MQVRSKIIDNKLIITMTDEFMIHSATVHGQIINKKTNQKDDIDIIFMKYLDNCIKNNNYLLFHEKNKCKIKLPHPNNVHNYVSFEFNESKKKPEKLFIKIIMSIFVVTSLYLFL